METDAVNLDCLTLGQIKSLVEMYGGASLEPHSMIIGEAYLIRCDIFSYVGRIHRVTTSDIALTNAAWAWTVAKDVPTMSDTFVNELPFPDGRVIIPRHHVLDISRWRYKLPIIS